jgi:hypothetical protein
LMTATRVNIGRPPSTSSPGQPVPGGYTHYTPKARSCPGGQSSI